MADVFLSYAREDLDRAKRVAAALEKAGLAVWWDRNLGGGSDYSREIELALKSAAAVVVLWSKGSVDSSWVRDEAAKGRDTGRLIPATIDGTEPPLGFGQLHTIDLQRAFRRRGGDLEKVVAAVREKMGGRSGGPLAHQLAQTTVSGASGERHVPQPRLLWIAAAAALVVVSAAMLYLFNALPLGTSVRDSADSGTVAIGDFEPVASDQETRRVARLTSESVERIFATNFIQTLSRRSATPAALKAAEFGLNGTVDRQGDELSVSARIVDSRAGTTLWSTERTRSAKEGRQLANELAIWVADVLRCSMFLKSRIREYSSTELTSRILRWCEAERSRGEQWKQMPSIAQELVEAAPKSAQAHGYLAMGLSLGEPDRREEIYSAARRALQGDPNNGVARFALAAVPDPKVTVAEREKLLRAGIRLDPDFPYNRPQLAFLMLSVGRTEGAIKLMDEFMNKYPLDLQQRAFLGFVLAQTGRLREARAQFDRLTELAPRYQTGIRRAIEAEILFGDPARAGPLIGRWNPDEHEQECLEFIGDARMGKRSPSTEEIRRKCEGSYSLDLLNGFFGHLDEAFHYLQLKRADYAKFARFGPHFVYYPQLAALRADSRFMPYMAELGIAQYWLETGSWPDFCATDPLPYDCRRAAAAAVTRVER